MVQDLGLLAFNVLVLMRQEAAHVALAVGWYLPFYCSRISSSLWHWLRAPFVKRSRILIVLLLSQVQVVGSYHILLALQICQRSSSTKSRSVVVILIFERLVVTKINVTFYGLLLLMTLLH